MLCQAMRRCAARNPPPKAESESVGTHWDTGRLEAFSDGVIAIAATLLILDVNVPLRDFADLRSGIVNQWPAYLGYGTSFLTIGGIWMAHHGLFRRLRYANSRVMRLNLILLMAVSFLPFPTRLVAETLGNEGPERTAVIFYGFTLLLTSVLLWALWSAATSDPDLLHPDANPNEIAAYTRVMTPNIGFYIVSTLIALRWPTVTAAIYFAIGASLVLRARGDVSMPGRHAGT